MRGFGVDAAGLAEMRFGAGKGRPGLVIMVTIGTGLGTALFHDGRLVPNSELGHLEVDGHEAEKLASDAARKVEDLSWKKWARRFGVYLNRLHAYFWPELFILGGGASKKTEKFMRYLDVPCEVVPAQLRNQARVSTTDATPQQVFAVRGLDLTPDERRCYADLLDDPAGR